MNFVLSVLYKHTADLLHGADCFSQKQVFAKEFYYLARLSIYSIIWDLIIFDKITEANTISHNYEDLNLTQ